MFYLTIRQNGGERAVAFEGTPLLDELLAAEGLSLPHPCGGGGRCGKCAVAVEGVLSPPTEEEVRRGCRLSCRTRLLGNAVVTLPDTAAAMQVETETAPLTWTGKGVTAGYAAAVDLGTTTVAVKVYAPDGTCCGTASAQNPQTVIAADVMGRIETALRGEGERLRTMILGTVRELIASACPDGVEPIGITVTGNTTMLYLLCGHDPSALSRAPFAADRLFDVTCTLPGLSAPVYLPPCMNAFVGADITCAVLAAGMCEQTQTALLCDIGTNGELALWKGGTLYVTSTAAGPAFEGAGITCGCGSIEGAVDRVWTENGGLCVHTIGEVPAVGICGSGVIDAVAAGLALGEIDESGAMEEPMVLSGAVSLHPCDVRAVQLAKAAIAAGIETLMESAGATAEEIGTLYIAGGFGSHLNVQSAARIGLIPAELAGKVKVLGNAALSGASMLLLDRDKLEEIRRIRAASRHVNLGGNPVFNEHYMDQMFFPE